MLYVPRHLPNKLEYKVLSCISVHYQLRMVPENRIGVTVCLMCVFITAGPITAGPIYKKRIGFFCFPPSLTHEDGMHERQFQC